MRTAPIEVVVFDVNETLFALDSLAPVFGAHGLDPADLPLWYARVLRDGFALTMLGQYRPFVEVAADALRTLSPEVVDDAAVAAVLEGFGRLAAHPDVRPALELLADSGVRAVTLTVGSADNTARLLAGAGLDGHVEQTLSVEAVRRWKPAPEPYRYAAQATGVSADRLALVAAHAWDCAGARRAGLRTGWVSRYERRPSRVFEAADVSGPDLPGVVRQLLRSGPGDPTG